MEGNLLKISVKKWWSWNDDLPYKRDVPLECHSIQEQIKKTATGNGLGLNC